jgi:YidC/Oxa1 family membrane protein insertase
MSNLPVESLKAGGILWFTDLTVPDPYFILPVVTCLSLWCALEFGVEAGNMPGMSALARKLMVRGMPLVLFPFIFSFPSALLTYWCTTNMISVVQVFILKIPSVRRTFNLPNMKNLNTSSQDLDPKGFVQGNSCFITFK